jgi:hypothetical protein
VDSPKDPKVGDIMRLVVHGALGPTTAEFIYTASAIVQKSRDAFEALDAVSAHVRANGDGTGLILCTTLEQQVRGVLRKQYSIQENLRRDWEADSATRANEPARVAGLEKSVDAMRRQLKAQEEVIKNYKQSLELYETKSPDKSMETAQQGQKSPDQTSQNTKALILAQEKEILALQRELAAKSKVQQEMLNTWASPERLGQLEAEVARLRDVEKEALVVKAEGEAMFRRTRSLDKESEALRHMVQALGTQLLEVKKGMLNGIPMDLSTGGPLPANQYDKTTDKVRKTLLEDSGVPTDSAHRLQVALAERDDLAAQVRELLAFVKESTEQASQDFESIAARDKVITDLRQQLTKFQELYDETVTEMQSELQKSVEEGAEIKRKLVQTHEMAMKELREYAYDLEAGASADRRIVELENKAHIEEERKANAALREQLHKSEQQIRTLRKDREKYEKEVCDKTELTKEELLQIAGKSASQRVQIIELEELLREAREEIKMLHAIIQTAADEANTRITNEMDQLQRSVAERESKYVSGMQDLSQALHETRDQLVEQLSQKKELSQQFSSQIQESKRELELKIAAVEKLTAEGDTLSQKLRLLEEDSNVVRDRCEKLARENRELKETSTVLRTQLKAAVEEEVRLNELKIRLDKENAKAQIDLQAAIDTLDSHKKKDLKRKDDILQQQKHNEELLELLQTQQGSLVQNAKDMAEYEKTIVQMAAELDQYRQVLVPPLLIPQPLVERVVWRASCETVFSLCDCVHYTLQTDLRTMLQTDLSTTPAKMEPDGSATSPAKLTRAAPQLQHIAGSSSTSPLCRPVSVESAKVCRQACVFLPARGISFLRSRNCEGDRQENLLCDMRTGVGVGVAGSVPEIGGRQSVCAFLP